MICLRGMAKTHIPTATIKTRVAQVLEHCEPQSDKYRTGFVLIKEINGDLQIKDKPLTKDEQKRADKLTQFILDCGTTENFWHADTFETFIRKLVTDALTLDQATFEVVRDRVGRPIEFFATDAATFRIADSFGNDDAGKGL
jgi:capsid portal protein